MKGCVTILLLLSVFFGLSAQDSANVISKHTVYYKDRYRTVKNPKKAYFVKNNIVYEDSTILEEFRNISRDEILTKKITKNDKPLGIWYILNKVDESVYSINTAKIHYCLEKNQLIQPLRNIK